MPDETRGDNMTPADDMPNKSAESAINPEALDQAANRIQDLLINLSQSFPVTTETDQQIFLEKFDQAMQELPEVSKTVAEAGYDYVRSLCPAAGIPPAMAHRLHRILQRHGRDAD
jgi:hypothetical protein